MLLIIRCQEGGFRQRLRFHCEQEQVELFGKKIRLLCLNRASRLPARKLAALCQNMPVLLSSQIGEKQRELLARAGMRLYAAPAVSPLSLRLCVNCAIELLEQSGIPFPCQALGIIDPHFRHAALTRHALLHLTQVRILTDNLPAAQQFAHQMMAEYGAPVTFSDNPSILPEDGLTFSPEGILPERNLPLLFPTQPSADTARAAPIFYSPKPVLPEQFTALTAEGVDGGDLLEALYALERCKMLEKQGPASLYLQKNGESEKEIAPAEASRILLQLFHEKRGM